MHRHRHRVMPLVIGLLLAMTVVLPASAAPGGGNGSHQPQPTNPCVSTRLHPVSQKDSDGDHLTDCQEENIYGTWSGYKDSDYDGLSDGA